MTIVPEVDWTHEDREIIWARLYRLYAQGAYKSLSDYIEHRLPPADFLDQVAYSCRELPNKRWRSMPRYDEAHGWHSIGTSGMLGVSVRLGGLRPI